MSWVRDGGTPQPALIRHPLYSEGPITALQSTTSLGVAIANDWVAITEDTFTTGGNTDFMISFTLPAGFTNASLRGLFMVDNSVVDIALNDTTLKPPSGYNYPYGDLYSPPEPFDSTTTTTPNLFAPGANELRFTANNGGPPELISQHGLDFVALVTYCPAQPQDGTLKICKVAGPGVAVGTLFTFNVKRKTVTIPAGPGRGYCKVVGSAYKIGTEVTVDEVLPPEHGVAKVTASPADRLVGKPDLVEGTAVVTIGSGVTEVTYTNKRTGYLEICKVSKGPGVSGDFQFNVASRTVSVPVGACSPALEVPAGSLTVTEVPNAGTKLIACSTAQPADLVNCDLPTQSATVTIKPGGTSTQTILTFTNRSRRSG